MSTTTLNTTQDSLPITTMELQFTELTVNWNDIRNILFQVIPQEEKYRGYRELLGESVGELEAFDGLEGNMEMKFFSDLQIMDNIISFLSEFDDTSYGSLPEIVWGYHTGFGSSPVEPVWEALRGSGFYLVHTFDGCDDLGFHYKLEAKPLPLYIRRKEE